jgi:hypothetical protein
MRRLSNEEIVGALHAAREAHLNEVMETLVGQEKAPRRAGLQAANVAAGIISNEAPYTTPLDSNLPIRPPSEAARRRAQEGITALRALREKIRARRGGKPFTEEELTAALHEARAAHDRGE